MSYLKIFPRKIIAQHNIPSGYIGKLYYDFEQYGRMYRSYYVDVILCNDDTLAIAWSIEYIDSENLFVGFQSFIKSLNYYLFEIQKFDPLTNWYKPFESQFEYCFKPVYFDMGLNQFLTKK